MRAVDMVLTLVDKGSEDSNGVTNVTIQGRLIVRESSGAQVRLADG
jgi:hypothetical protein